MKKLDPFYLAMTRDNFNEEIERFKDDNLDPTERWNRDEEKWGEYYFLDYHTYFNVKFSLFWNCFYFNHYLGLLFF